jgi:hypothetical protein
MKRQPGIWIGAAAAALSALLGSPSAGQSPAGGPWRASSSQAAPQETKKLPQVTIEAQREGLRGQVHSFVYDITSRVDEIDSLALWDRPICPLVAGLTMEHGEAVLTRLSQIIAAAGAPLAGPRCDPNFNVVVTSDPERLLRKWRARDRLMFGPPPPRDGEETIRRFMHSNRPVRVWYNTQLTTNFGDTPGEAAFGLGSDFGGAPLIKVWTAPRLTWTALQKVASVIIVVDEKLVKGYTLGQIADYVGMVGLTQLNLDAPPEAGPTILRLFAARSADQSRPPGLSSWDQSFLKALYSTDQGSRWQRSQIVTQVVQSLAP